MKCAAKLMRLEGLRDAIFEAFDDVHDLIADLAGGCR